MQYVFPFLFVLLVMLVSPVRAQDNDLGSQRQCQLHASRTSAVMVGAKAIADPDVRGYFSVVSIARPGHLSVTVQNRSASEGTVSIRCDDRFLRASTTPRNGLPAYPGFEVPVTLTIVASRVRQQHESRDACVLALVRLANISLGAFSDAGLTPLNEETRFHHSIVGLRLEHFIRENGHPSFMSRTECRGRDEVFTSWNPPLIASPDVTVSVPRGSVQPHQLLRSPFASFPNSVSFAELSRTCLVPRNLEPMDHPRCRILASGVMDVEGFAYQIQEWQDGPEADVFSRVKALVLMDFHPNGSWVMGHSIGPVDGTLSTPRVINPVGMENRGVLVWTPNQTTGSAAPTMDTLARRPRIGAPWVAVETEGWQRELQQLLPQGLTGKSGFRVDYQNMTAMVPLARPQDSNAENTGGTAQVRLMLRGDRVVIRDFRHVSGRRRTT